MKLVYIYGMPAVGKLTVAKELEKITGFKLFHNHLTADYVSSLFPLKNEMSNQLKYEVAYKMFEAAAQHDINIIFTMAHNIIHNGFVENIVKIIEKYNGKILFVKLTCQKDKLYERVIKNSRKKFGKAKTIEEMDDIILREKEFSTLKESLIIDNTYISPKKCAQKIKEHYKL